MNITDVVEFKSGTPQFRISEEAGTGVPVYAFYTQADYEADLRGLSEQQPAGKYIRTCDVVCTATAGDVVFSLLSGAAAIVQPERNDRLLTQNYVVLVPSAAIDACYLVYLLNECHSIRHQLHVGQQGSITMKYTLKQLRELKLPSLPPKETQQLIGQLYLDQLKLDALRKRVSELETTLVLESIRKADQQWTS